MIHTESCSLCIEDKMTAVWVVWVFNQIFSSQVEGKWKCFYLIWVFVCLFVFRFQEQQRIGHGLLVNLPAMVSIFSLLFFYNLSFFLFSRTVLLVNLLCYLKESVNHM